MSFAAQIHPAEASTLFFKCVTSLVAQMVKRLPTMKETWIQPLGWEDLLEKEMTTHSSILAWKIPWMEEPGRPYMTEQLHFTLFFKYSFKTFIQNSCLENPMDGGA